MKLFRNVLFSRTLTFSVLTGFCLNIFIISESFALTSGPKSPDFSSYQPISATDMVNTFTGEFSYSVPVIQIPGPGESGYSLSLNYNSGVSSEEEASWVGLGWKLSPGVIDRSKRGIPDDFDDTKSIDYYNHNDANWSFSAKRKIGAQLFAKKIDNTALDIGLGTTLRYNNNTGYFRSFNLDMSTLGILSVGAEYSASGITYSAQISPYGIAKFFRKSKEKRDKKMEKDIDKILDDDKLTNNQKIKQLNKKLDFNKKREKLNSRLYSPSSSLGAFSFSDFSKPPINPKYSGFSVNVAKTLSIEPSTLPIGLYTGDYYGFNIQKNHTVSSFNSVGYMYSVNSADEHVKDYYVEKGNNIGIRDLFLGMPFNNADFFNVSCDGLGGSFKFKHNSIGIFSPAKIKNSLIHINFAKGLDLGADIGVSIDIGGGVTDNIVRKWGSSGVKQFGTESNGRFVFLHDLGDYGKDNLMNSNNCGVIDLEVKCKVPGIKNAKIGDVSTSKNQDVLPYENYVFSRATPITYSKTGSLIEKFSIVNDKGTRFQFNENLKVFNEGSLQVSEGGLAGTVDNNYIINSVSPTYTPAGLINYFSDFKDNGAKKTTFNKVVGEINKNPYAVNYLLTEILDYDYQDINANGVDNADYGSWTKFAYETASPNYEFRYPYSGFLYEENSYSISEDNMGQVNFGSKELKYLNKIETKTHIAYFVNNESVAANFGNAEGVDFLNPSKVALRLDARDASNTNPASCRRSRYLDKIVLFSKNNLAKPLYTVRFDYGYSLCSKTPNNSSKTGKLTLNKVWFEYEGVNNARIAPYVFSYNYPFSNEYSGILGKSKYPDFFTLLGKYSTATQNPDYNPHLLDAWGNIQYKGNDQNRLDRPWLNQANMSDDDARQFDPAAWHMKQIQLPSGGKILVEYEQNTYRFVQDRAVSGMASVNDYYWDSGDKSGYGNMDIYLNPEDLNISSTQLTNESANIISMVNNWFEFDGNSAGRKIYYKFLFNQGNLFRLNNVFKPSGQSSEYITGYGSLIKQVNNQLVSITTAPNTGKLCLKITIEGKLIEGSGTKTTSPRQAAYDFFSTQRVEYGDLKSMNGFMNTDVGDYYNGRDSDAGFVKIAKRLAIIGLSTTIVSNFGFTMDGKLFDGRYSIPNPDNVANTMASGNSEVSQSYLKLPLYSTKRGGGVRVKRLYTFDQGLEQVTNSTVNDAVLYGTEYIYKTSDGLCSGVATNEPAGMREENPLVQYLPKKEQTLYSRLTTGVEKDNSEGPLGESLLPSASIGYSRVVTKNIYEGTSSNGFTVNEYYTVKDYPFDMGYKNMSNVSSRQTEPAITSTSLGVNSLKDKFSLPIPFFSYSVEKYWATQGFRFIINSMHGQAKKVTAYGGKYSNFTSGNTSIYDKYKNVYVVSGKEYFYYEPGENVKLIAADGTFISNVPGKEVDATIEIKQNLDRSMNFGLSISMDLGVMLPPPPYPAVFPDMSYVNNSASIAANTKVIRYPTILKKVVSHQDGISSSQEYLAFDKSTGGPILSRTSDEFNGLNYTFDMPAYWKHSGMGKIDDNSSNHNLIGEKTMNFHFYEQPGVVAKIITYNANNTWSFDYSKLLSASATVFNNNPTITNNKWKPIRSHVYNTKVASRDVISPVKTDIKQSGLYLSPSSFTQTSIDQIFASSSAANWIITDMITQYSKNGDAIEQTNALNIPSSALYDTKYGSYPIMVSKNANKNSVYFNDFESYTDFANFYPLQGGDFGGVAHSGSLSAATGGMGLLIPAVIQSYGKHLIRFWASLETDRSFGFSGANYEFPTPIVNFGGKDYGATKVATSGGWNLYSVVVNVSSSNHNLTIITNPNGATGVYFYVDDLRIEPLAASSKCFSYDASQRLSAEFDDQHFGMYYQYNAEGKLIRKIAETEKGKKTLMETQYNVKLQKRDQ